MNRSCPPNVASLFCSKAIAVALGAGLVPAPTSPTAEPREIVDSVRAGNVIAVATPSGEYFLWPLWRAS
ncbi:hypothetical protein [Nitrobacter hamburgensis]|uniref:hypothetical protein n=1 Tax=Nitrobacter hamburgensis TaxID=912 RepID=UPI0012EE46F8|nr:hypothetical protein [Nitrobacter hamburgensis]